jgi:hypothetical protein
MEEDIEKAKVIKPEGGLRTLSKKRWKPARQNAFTGSRIDVVFHLRSLGLTASCEGYNKNPGPFGPEFSRKWILIHGLTLV